MTFLLASTNITHGIIITLLEFKLGQRQEDEFVGILSKLLVDNREKNSLATVLRRKRFSFLLSLIAPLQRPIKILDIGGVQVFWDNMGLISPQDVQVTLLNIFTNEVTLPNFSAVIGDARSMPQYKQGEFDVIFSNSVIEHVGDFQDQRQMANEVRRVGQRYFVQTPNRNFPIEPHFLVPFFQFLPIAVRVYLVRRFNMGWYKKIPNPVEALEFVQSHRLLTERELRELFPGARVYKEKLFGLTKSFIVYDGWK